ncbi:focadhesin-like isoform X2 [Oscarella lobularis]|uniref:focadhesin-like isoform X2 n=1 Tax=Oscarella lobularis TaxID=121494 RepID=UPI003313DEE1
MAKVRSLEAVAEIVLKVCQRHKINPKGVKESNEFSSLVGGCQSSNRIVADACCSGVVRLVEDGLLDCREAILALVNVTPMCHHGGVYVVKSVAAMLVRQVQRSVDRTGEYKCTYGSRTRPHPFVMLLNCHSGGDVWPVLLMEIKLAYSRLEAKYLPFLIVMLEPFFTYAFFEVVKTSAHQLAASCLHSTLLLIVDEMLVSRSTEWDQVEPVSVGILTFLLRARFFFLSKSCEVLNQLTLELQLFVEWLLRHPPFCKVFCPKVLSHLLRQCLELQSEGLSVAFLLPLIDKLLDVGAKNIDLRTTLFVLAYLLLGAPESEQIALLQTGQRVISAFVDHSQSVCLRLLSLLVYPLLSIVVVSPKTSETILGESNALFKRSLATELLSTVEAISHTDDERQEGDFAKTAERDFEHCDIKVGSLLPVLDVCCRTLHGLLTNRISTVEWLSKLMEMMPAYRQKPVPVYFVLIGAALFSSPLDEARPKVLQFLKAVALSDPAQSVSLLHLFLYQLNLESIPEVKLHIMYSIPDLATHRLAVQPVLRSLQKLAENKRLQPLSIRLIGVLWQKQDRIFPYLLQVLSACPIGFSDGDPIERSRNYELQLSQAACILDVCRLRASQHGADLVGLLSRILNAALRDPLAPCEPAALTIEALKFLCLADVIDLPTAWSSLASKVLKDRRPLLLKQACSLLKVTFELCEDEDFIDSVVRALWEVALNPLLCIANEAYAALAELPLSCLKFDLLPSLLQKQVLKSVSRTLAASLTVTDDEDEDDQKDRPSIPGVLLTHLLAGFNQQSRDGLHAFACNAFRHELKNMPRGIVRTAEKLEASKATSASTLRSLAVHLQRLYEKPPRPGMSKYYAAGLMLCFTSEASETYQSKVALARVYTRLLNGFLNEVDIVSFDWMHQASLIDAWLTFMKGDVTAVAESRQAEISVKKEKDVARLTDEEWCTAFEWACNHLKEKLVAASRGTSVVQANSLFAFCGLACAVLESSDDVMSSRSKSEWIGAVVDTFLVVLDSNYVPVSSDVVKMCVKGNSRATSVVARSSAALCLAEISLNLLQCLPERLVQVLESLRRFGLGTMEKTSAIGEQCSQISLLSALDVSCCWSLGRILRSLYREMLLSCQLEEITRSIVDEIFLAIRNKSFAAILAFSHLSAALVTSSGLVVKIKEICGDLRFFLSDVSKSVPLPNLFYCSYFALSESAIHLYKEKQFTSDDIRSVSGLLTNHTKDHHLLSFIFGTFLHELVALGHEESTAAIQDITKTWQSAIKADRSLSESCKAALYGLVGSAGCCSKSNATRLPSKSLFNLRELLRSLKGWLTAEDSATCAVAASSIGLFARAVDVRCVGTSVPSDCRYLPETSFVRAAFNILKSDVRGVAVVELLLSALGSQEKLPSTDWSSILSTAINEQSESLKVACTTFAARQLSSGNVRDFSRQLLVPKRFFQLSFECERVFLDSLWLLCRDLSSADIRQFIESVVLPRFLGTNASSANFCIAALKGLQCALKVRNSLVKAMQDILIEATTVIYRSFESTPALLDNSEMNGVLASCLAYLPAEIIFSASADQNFEFRQRCLLVKAKKFQLNYLQPVMEWAIAQDQEAFDDKRAERIWKEVLDSLETCDESEWSPKKEVVAVDWCSQLIGLFDGAPYHAIALPFVLAVIETCLLASFHPLVQLLPRSCDRFPPFLCYAIEGAMALEEWQRIIENLRNSLCKIMKSNEMDVELLMNCLRCFANRDYIAGQISLCT